MAQITKRILLVEDEPGLVRTLTDRLSKEGYAAESAADGPSGFQMASNGSGGSSFDLIILDVMLPGCSGLDVCRNIRQRGVKTPILMLTAKSQTVDKVVGLKLGADDYLVKPFEMMELLARIEALLRRASSGATANLRTLEFGPIRIDLLCAKVFREDQPVDLTFREFKLLRYFVEHRGAVLSRDDLLNAVWGYNEMPFTRTVDVHVASLRRKLEPNPRYPQFILTAHGFGYQFAER
jgi:two-component system alkaline phosphatase synthesis response regulator PhoP